MPKKKRRLRLVDNATTGELMAELATRRFDWTDQTCNDDANAERFVRDHGEDVVYIPEKELFLVWDDAHGWVPDRYCLAVEALAVRTARGILQEAANAATVDLNDDKARLLSRWANTSRSGPHTKEMYRRARTQLQRPVSDFDRKPRTLAFQNGVVSLDTGEFRPYERDDLFTMRLAFDYDPDATCPQWRKFLDEAQPDPEIRDYLQRAAGMTAVGEVRDHYLFVCYGPPRAGKGTFVGTLSTLFGEYHHALSREVLLARTPDTIRFKLSALDGKRMSACDELPRNARLNSAVLNSLVSGDPQEVEAKYRDSYTMRPVATYWINTNHRPDLPTSETATWARLRLVPFDVSYQGRESVDLRALLATELPGIANWVVEGAVRYLAAPSLLAPAAVLASTARFHQDADVLRRFLAEEGDFMASRPRMVSGSSGRPSVAARLAEWCAETGASAPTQADVIEGLRSLGWVDRKSRGLTDADQDVVKRWLAPLAVAPVVPLSAVVRPGDNLSHEDVPRESLPVAPTTGTTEQRTQLDMPALLRAAVEHRPKTAAEEQALLEAMWAEQEADDATEEAEAAALADSTFQPA